MRRCDRCKAEMAPGRPRVRVARELWCQTCVKDKDAPSGVYRPGSDIAKAALSSDPAHPDNHLFSPVNRDFPICTTCNFEEHWHPHLHQGSNAVHCSVPGCDRDMSHYLHDKGKVEHLTVRDNPVPDDPSSMWRIRGSKTAAFGMSDEDTQKWVPHVHHLVHEHGMDEGHLMELLQHHVGKTPQNGPHQDLMNLVAVTKAAQQVHHDAHGNDYRSPALNPNASSHTHGPEDPLASQPHRPHPESHEYARTDQTHLWDAGPVPDYHRTKNFQRNLHPDRPDHLPNFKEWDDLAHPGQASNLGGCSQVYPHTGGDRDEESCHECGAKKWLHAEHRPSEVGKVKQHVYENRGTDFTRRKTEPFKGLPQSLNSRRVAVEDFTSRYEDDHARLQHRYRGQHGAVTAGPDGEPTYEISHPSGYLGRIGHGPTMAISHQATPDVTYDTQSVGAMTDQGHGLHPSMDTDDPLVNHHRAMWHLDNWVKTWGGPHSQATPAIKHWKGRRGLASKATRGTPEKRGFMKKIAMTNVRTGQRLIVVAHDSGDGQTIYHCPFCGSGQVIARSDGTVECEFCHTMFTVQVQPEFNAFPQTIDGQPVQVPGMPGQIDDPTDPTGGVDPTDPTQTDTDQDGQPDATDADTNGDGVSDNFAGPASADNQPPWLKGALLRTSTGALLSPDDFVAHLAIKHADDKTAVAMQVRSSRRSQ